MTAPAPAPPAWIARSRRFWFTILAPVVVLLLGGAALATYWFLAPGRDAAQLAAQQDGDAEQARVLKLSAFNIATVQNSARGPTNMYRFQAVADDPAAIFVNGTPADAERTKRTVAWLQAAAAEGDATAMNNLGVFHALGRNAPKDNAKALSLFERAARLGSGDAWDNMIYLYRKSNRVPTLPSESFATEDEQYAAAYKVFQAWEKKADEGDVVALVYVAKLNAAGKVPTPKRTGFYESADKVATPAQLLKAATLYQKAAQAGYPEAQFALGSLMLRLREPEAKLRGTAMLLLAARAGHRGAIVAFGDNASGLSPADRARVDKFAGANASPGTKLVDWCYRAARRGDFDAPRELASIYAGGLDVPQDVNLAKAWLIVAGSGASPSSDLNFADMDRYIDVQERLMAAEFREPKADARADKLAEDLLKKLYP